MVLIAQSRSDERAVRFCQERKGVWWSTELPHINLTTDEHGIPLVFRELEEEEILPITPVHGKMGTWMMIEILYTNAVVYLENYQADIINKVLESVGSKLIQPPINERVMVNVGGKVVEYVKYLPPLKSILTQNTSPKMKLCLVLWLSVAAAVKDHAYWSGRRCFREACEVVKIVNHLKAVEAFLVPGAGMIDHSKNEDLRSSRFKKLATFKDRWPQITESIGKDDHFSEFEMSVLSWCGRGRRGTNLLPFGWELKADRRTGLPEMVIDKEDYRLVLSLSGTGTGDHRSRTIQLTGNCDGIETTSSSGEVLSRHNSLITDAVQTAKKLYFVAPEMYRYNLITRYNAWYNVDRLTIKIELGSEHCTVNDHCIREYAIRSALYGGLYDSKPLSGLVQDPREVLDSLLVVSSLVQENRRNRKLDPQSICAVDEQLRRDLWLPLYTRTDCKGMLLMFLATDLVYHMARQEATYEAVTSKNKNCQPLGPPRNLLDHWKAFRWWNSSVSVSGGQIHLKSHLGNCFVITMIVAFILASVYGHNASKRNVSFEDAAQTLLAILAISLPLVYKAGELILDVPSDVPLSYLGATCVTSDIIALCVDSGGRLISLLDESGITVGGASCVIGLPSVGDADPDLLMPRPFTARELEALSIKSVDLGGTMCLVDSRRKKLSKLVVTGAKGMLHCKEWVEASSADLQNAKPLLLRPGVLIGGTPGSINNVKALCLTNVEE